MSRQYYHLSLHRLISCSCFAFFHIISCQWPDVTLVLFANYTFNEVVHIFDKVLFSVKTYPLAATERMVLFHSTLLYHSMSQYFLIGQLQALYMTSGSV